MITSSPSRSFVVRISLTGGDVLVGVRPRSRKDHVFKRNTNSNEQLRAGSQRKKNMHRFQLRHPSKKLDGPNYERIVLPTDTYSQRNLPTWTGEMMTCEKTVNALYFIF